MHDKKVCLGLLACLLTGLALPEKCNYTSGLNQALGLTLMPTPQP